jgi:hypothetical protein
MRWRVVAAVLFALACSYGILWGFGYATARLGEILDAALGGQPRFEVSRGTLTLPAGEEKRLRVETVAGEVEVLPGGPDTVAEYVVYARGEDEADARLRARAVEAGCGGNDASGNFISAKAAQGKRWPPGVSVKLAVRTPPDRDLSVKVVSADVSVQGIEGPIDASAVSGDVSVRDSVRPVAAHTVSGDIRVDDAAGAVDARTTSGDVVLTALLADQIDAHTVSGDIRIESALPFSGRLESKSVSGDVRVALPGGSDCEVHAKTVSGDIRGGPWSEVSRGRAGTRLGAGAGSVNISATSGDIHLNTEE